MAIQKRPWAMVSSTSGGNAHATRLAVEQQPLPRAAEILCVSVSQPLEGHVKVGLHRAQRPEVL